MQQGSNRDHGVLEQFGSDLPGDLPGVAAPVPEKDSIETTVIKVKVDHAPVWSIGWVLISL